jgi:type I restriction enzyme S subunit
MIFNGDSGARSDRFNIRTDLFYKMPIPMPNIEEQKEISQYFTKLFDLITLHQRKHKKLLNIKKTMLEKMFPKDGEVVPEIRFKGFTDDWEQRKLSDMGEIVTGSTPSTSHFEYYSDDGIPWVTPTDIIGNTISDTPRKLSAEGEKVGRVVPAETILVTCIASIGKNTMLVNKGSFNQQINGLIPNKQKYDPYFLLTDSFLWSKKMKVEAAAGTMQIVNKNEFSAIETIIPSLLEQQKIGAYFKNLDNLITLHQRKLDKLEKIKKAMLEKMFV